jgi:hypothetical protein
MKPQCADAVRATAKELGREGVTDAELRAIESRLSDTMRRLARSDENWRTYSRDMRVSLAAEQAMHDVRAEAERKVQNTALQVVKTAATEQRIGDAMRLLEADRAHALVHDLDQTAVYITGVKHEAMGHLMALLDAVKSGEGASVGRRLSMLLFDAQNPQMTRDLAVEIFRNADGSSGNKLAREGAMAYHRVIEELRQRFNAAGGDVRRLEYGYIPQPHDAAMVRAAGMQGWVEKTLPLLDRSRYVLEDGNLMSDKEVREFLEAAWQTIQTDGLNKQEPGSFRSSGARANRGSESRQIHFKDAASYLAYMSDFGRGSMYDAVVGHVGGLARDIGLTERYGPNPNAQMRLQFDLAARHDGTQPDNLRRVFGLQPQSYWDVLSGTAGAPQSARIAQIGTDIRNIQTFGKLASAVISSITDLGTYVTTTGYNRLGYWNAIRNIGKSATSAEARRFLTSHGIIAESMIGDLNRWAGDNIRQTWSGRLAQSTLRLSLMGAWTDTLRRAFSLTMMQGLARMSRTSWDTLDGWDRALMERRGLTAEDWAVMQSAQLTPFQGLDHLTPESIRATSHERAREVVSKVLGLIQDESEFAVLNPDLATKTIGSFGGQQRGTITGELARSVMQFKSFPIAMVSRHWRRMLDAPAVSDGTAPLLANRVVYAGALMLSTTALGAIALQAKQIVAGKDPIDMRGDHAAKFWAKAVAQGGGLSIMGDMVLNDPGSDPGGTIRSIAGSAAGPAISTAMEVAGRGITDSWRAIKGKETHTSAEMLSIARANAPFVNLWYAKAALDHAGMHALQENLSPGYLARMKQRAHDEFGQDFWWQPGTGSPARAPELGKAVGQ